MPVSNTGLECRLLCASALTFGIGPDGELQQLQPYYNAVGFKAPPTAVVGGLEGINVCLVGVNGDGIVVAFRGTLPPVKLDTPTVVDWLNDFDALPIAVPGIPGLVHQGFWDSVESIYGSVLDVVRELRRVGGATLPIYVTGHSKGGALAHLAAMRLKLLDGIEPAEVVTYGAPRAADLEFATAYHKTIKATRYEYRNDIVPHVPPSIMLARIMAMIPRFGLRLKRVGAFDYTSLGTLKYIENPGHIVEDSRGLVVKRYARLVTAIATGKIAQLVLDHDYACGGGYMTSLCPSELCR
jgi:hypothetical protein